MSFDFLKVVTDIPENIGIIFQKIGNFIDSVVIVFLNGYVIFVVLIFVLLFLLLFYIPLKVYPMYRKNKRIIDKIVKLDYD